MKASGTMAVETMDDVIRFLGRTRERVLNRVEALPAPARVWRPAPDRWAPLEHLEHLALTEQRLVAQLRQMVEEAEAAGCTAPPGAVPQVDALPALLAAGAVGTPKQAPPETRPRGLSLDRLAAMLRASRADLLLLAERLGRLDTDRMQAEIPVADVRLSAAQMLHFVGLHERLHLQHMEQVAGLWANRPTP